MRKQMLKYVGDSARDSLVETAYLVCIQCGVELHGYLHEERREGEASYDQWFACCRCNASRRWGLLNVPRAGRRRIRHDPNG
jgi:hypothetical protein